MQKLHTHGESGARLHNDMISTKSNLITSSPKLGRENVHLISPSIDPHWLKYFLKYCIYVMYIQVK